MVLVLRVGEERPGAVLTVRAADGPPEEALARSEVPEPRRTSARLRLAIGGVTQLVDHVTGRGSGLAREKEPRDKRKATRNGFFSQR